jgi:hypothetical protein
MKQEAIATQCSVIGHTPIIWFVTYLLHIIINIQDCKDSFDHVDETKTRMEIGRSPSPNKNKHTERIGFVLTHKLQ